MTLFARSFVLATKATAIAIVLLPFSLSAVSVPTAADVTDTTGTVDYELSAGGAFGTGISFNILKYLGLADTITGNFQAREIENSGTGPLTFEGNPTIGSSLNLNLRATTAAISVNGVISNNLGGASSLTVYGPHTTYLTAANLYTGRTIIDGGVLDVGTISNNSLGSGGLLFYANGVLQGNGAFVRNTSGNETPGAGQYGGQSGGFAARGGELTLDLTNAANDIVDLNTGGWRFGANLVFGSATADSKVVLLNHLNINTDGQRIITVVKGVGGDSAELRGNVLNSSTAGQISGFIKRGDGLLYLSSASNSYRGITTIDAGTISINSIGNGGDNSTLGASSNAATNLVFNGGALQYTGANGSTDRSFSINAARTATIEVTNAATNLTFTGNINTTNTSGGLAKTGAGTLTITGTKNYTGRTTITAGIFDVGDVATLGNSALYFNAPTGGTALLQGYGTLTRTFDNTATPEANLVSGEVAGKTGGFSAKGGDLILNLGPVMAFNSALNVFGDNFILNSSASDSKVQLTSNINLNSSNSTRNITVNSGVGGDYAHLSGNIYEPEEQNSGIAKLGAGILVLSGANTYEGPTNVNAGTLVANYTGPDTITSPTNPPATLPASSTGAGHVTVATAGTLAGYGKIGAGSTLVTINGRLNPGDPTLGNTRGTLTINGNLTLGSAAITQLEIASLSEFDKVIAMSTATLDGTINLDFTNFSSSLFASSFTLDVFDWSNVVSTGFTVGNGTTGDLKLLNVNYGGNTGSWDLTHFTDAGIGGGTISWNAVAIPEPTRPLLLLTTLCLALVRRSRRSRDD